MSSNVWPMGYQYLSICQFSPELGRRCHGNVGISTLKRETGRVCCLSTKTVAINQFQIFFFLCRKCRRRVSLRFYCKDIQEWRRGINKSYISQCEIYNLHNPWLSTGNIYMYKQKYLVWKRKRKRSDLVLWQKPIWQTKLHTNQCNSTKAQKNADYTSIADRLKRTSVVYRLNVCG